MPYISQKDRPQLDDIVDELYLELGPYFEEGQLNYVIFRLCGKLFKARRKYETINKINGVLHSVQIELNRRLFSQYENEKIEENGDVTFD